MKKNYQTRITQMTVCPEEDSLFSELATRVSIDDEGGGEFVGVTQDKGKIRIDPEEWRPLCEAINKMISECKVSK